MDTKNIIEPSLDKIENLDRTIESSQDPKNKAIGGESPINTFYSPTYSKRKSNVILTDLYPLTNIHLNTSKPSEPNPYQTRIKITRKPKTHLSQPLHSEPKITDSLLMLQLSSQGQFLDSMQKEMTKKQRWKSVIDHTFETQKQQLRSSYEYRHKHDRQRQYIHKVFNQYSHQKEAQYSQENEQRYIRVLS